MQALLNPSPLKYGALPFDQFQTADFLPALEVAIKDAYVELERWKKERSAAFKDVIVSLDDLRETISQISSIFYNLHSAHTNDELEYEQESNCDVNRNTTLQRKYSQPRFSH
jgi:peptidyl-dipeptidase Dcp